MSLKPSLSIRIKGDVIICVPDSLESMTTYLLLEQEDSVDDEASFVREYIQPGMNVVDMKPDFGLYAIPAAKKISENGKIWILEPPESVAGYLKQTVSMNDLKNLIWIPKNKIKYLNDYIDYKQTNIDFFRINTKYISLKNVKKVLDQISPLIMCLLPDDELNKNKCILELKNLGFSAYRLIPDLKLLKPFTEKSYYSNILFFCKEDRSKMLSKRGLLILSSSWSCTMAKTPRNVWLDYLQQFPYATCLLKLWHKYLQTNGASGHWATHQGALNMYAMSKISASSLADKYIYLQQAYENLSRLLVHYSNLSRLQSMARISMELGMKDKAYSILNQLVAMFESNDQVSLNEPFLSVSQRYDNINPKDFIGHWCLASILEQRELLESSYVTGYTSLESTEILKNLGFQTPEIERRRQLVRMRYGLQNNPSLNPVLTITGEDNLNPWYWNKNSK
ncbi:putative Methyltransferase FkbM domain-containing protein [Candidatus Magnetomoraceae bacterium gMMP-15]